MLARHVAILLYDEVEVLDFAGPFEVFSVAAEQLGAGALRVSTVAERNAPVTAIGGLRVLPDGTLAAVPFADIVVVPGGNGSRRAMENQAVLEWVREAGGRAELTMSICSGARILARAGALDGLAVTTHHEVIDDLRELAPHAVVDPSRRVIDTGRVLTTGGISAGIDGSLYLISRLFGPDAARRAASYMEYDWRPEALANAREGGAVRGRDGARQT